jgi:hypothetical protein
MPALANAAFEYQIQVCMWMFIGTAYQWPPTLMTSTIGCGQHAVPVVAPRDLVDRIEHVFLDDVEELLGGVELGGGGRIAADDAVDGDGARLVAAGDGANRSRCRRPGGRPGRPA